MSGTEPCAPSRRRFLRLSLAAPLFAAKPVAAAPAYPSRIVRLVLPFSPGGPSDLIARLLGAELEKSLGQPFVVENRPGAASNIGTAMVARAEPDGHTLLIAANNLMINASLYTSPGYDPVRDFAPITVLAASPCLIVANASTGIATLGDLIARDRAKPGALNYSTPGVGTPNHLVFELLASRTDLKVVHVPYQGGAPAVQAVLAGTTQLASSLLPNVLPHIQAGTLNALAVTGRERLAELPAVPTLAESGYADIDTEIVFMLLAPARTPDAILDRLAAEADRILNQPEARARLQGAGFTVRTRGRNDLRERIAAETATFSGLVARLGLAVR